MILFKAILELVLMVGFPILLLWGLWILGKKMENPECDCIRCPDCLNDDLCCACVCEMEIDEAEEDEDEDASHCGIQD